MNIEFCVFLFYVFQGFIKFTHYVRFISGCYMPMFCNCETLNITFLVTYCTFKSRLLFFIILFHIYIFLHCLANSNSIILSIDFLFLLFKVDDHIISNFVYFSNSYSQLIASFRNSSTTPHSSGDNRHFFTAKYVFHFFRYSLCSQFLITTNYYF